MPPRFLAVPVLLVLALALTAAQARAGAGPSVTGAAAAPAAQPGTGTRNMPAPSHKVARSDRKFIEEAANSSMFEVQIGQLAASKATDPDVRSLANMLVDQHTAATNELVKIADTLGVELPPAPRHSLRRQIDKLARKNGAEFDRDFVRQVGIKAHEKDIETFEKAGKDVEDPQLRAFALKSLAMLREHLAAAQKLPESGQNAAAMGASKH